MNSYIGTKEASIRLKISVRRVQALIAAGRLPAKKIGNSFAINENDLKLLNGRANGRPTNGTKTEEKDWNAILDKFIGCVSIGPDRSTNKKWMEGYGR